jgi:hexosaminidase
LQTEAYELIVAKNSVTIKASSNAGFVYGLETIYQLLPPSIESKKVVANINWEIPICTIKDKPRFKYRGLMLDVSRHFFNKEYIKKTIDGLAMHKMNVLHLHLVDDQGWRIEIKKYPKLTEVGAWRVDQEDKHWIQRRTVSPEEKGTYGGFLTQKELKEIIAYAQSKNIDIIPEIEMPAHVSCAIAAYPYLSCSEKRIGVPSGSVWPITDIYCAGKETTFQFLENVLEEVIDIFPSKYIHIGGDEATKTNWKTCPYCQKRMKNEGLTEVEELQSYFVKRIEKFINSKGKKLIGWDEILEGGLAPEATVMSWRGVKGGLEAAAEGHDVIMTPGTHCYFDHYQGPQEEEPLAIGGFTPLSKVYQFDPIVASMTPEEASHVLGGQANLWSEYIPTESHSEYMIYPRLAALSETLWSPKELRNWKDFSTRIITMFERYTFQERNYAKSSFLVTTNTVVDLNEKKISLTLQNEFPLSDIRFVIGNGDLKHDAIQYIKPIELKESTIVKASLFKNDKPVGNIIYDTIIIHKALAKKVKYITPYHEKYTGVGAFNLVNALRGTKNFKDGQWQGWLNNDMEISIDLEKKQPINSVTVGTMDYQRPSIFLPTSIEVLVSNNGIKYTQVKKIEIPFVKSNLITLRNFKIQFDDVVEAQFIKVIATCLKNTPQGGGAWLFVDEILIE